MPATAVYTAKTSLVTYDNLGNQVTLDVYMTKTDDRRPGKSPSTIRPTPTPTSQGFPT